jgi:hypothetical protein
LSETTLIELKLGRPCCRESREAVADERSLLAPAVWLSADWNGQAVSLYRTAVAGDEMLGRSWQRNSVRLMKRAASSQEVDDLLHEELSVVQHVYFYFYFEKERLLLLQLTKESSG